MALGLGIDTGVRPGGNAPKCRTGPPSNDVGGDERREVRLVEALPLPLGSLRIGEKLGMAI